MESFYIFLDIDGVLYDWNFIIETVKDASNKRGGIIDKFSPKSIDALNYLISELNSIYDVTLVISSSWRINMKKTSNVLIKNGLKYYKDFEKTPITNTPNERGKEILSYLNAKKNPSNFVIIDDESFDFSKYFSTYNIIKTNIYNKCLDMKMVTGYLDRLFLNKKQENEK